MPFLFAGYPITDITNPCHQYDFLEDYWNRCGISTGNRYDAGFDSDDHWGLVISGGYSPVNGRIALVTKTLDGNYFEALESLPYATYYHCLVILDDDQLFMAGGYGSTSYDTDTYVYDATTNTWSEDFGDLYVGRQNLACGVVRDESGKPLEIVVAGGKTYTGLDERLVEIYNIENGVWRYRSKSEYNRTYLLK